MINFPSSPTLGQTVNVGNKVYAWNGTAWEIPTSPAGGGGGGGASVTTDDIPPSLPKDGDMWLKTTTGVLYVYYDDSNSKQWVQVSATPQMIASPQAWEVIGPSTGGIFHTLSAVATYDVKDLAPFRKLRLSGTITPSATGGLAFRVSVDNGATFISSTSDYGLQYCMFSQTTVTANQVASTVGYITNSGPDAGSPINVLGHFEEWNQAGVAIKGFLSESKFRVSTILARFTSMNTMNAAAPCNALRLMNANGTGTLTGNFLLEGVRG